MLSLGGKVSSGSVHSIESISTYPYIEKKLTANSIVSPAHICVKGYTYGLFISYERRSS